jgi:hypothetical protein
MNKFQRCLLHTRCIVTKVGRGENFRWHIHHLEREFGCGPYREPDEGAERLHPTAYVVSQ